MEKSNQVLKCRLIPACFECPYIDIEHNKEVNAIHTIRGDDITLVSAEIWCTHEDVCATMMRIEQPDISELAEKYLDEEEEKSDSI